MLLKNKGIASKFIVIVSLVTIILMIGLAALIVIKAENSQTEMARNFIETLKEEQAQEEQLLRQGLLQKGESMLDLLAKNAAGAIVSYDFLTLQQVADSGARDQDVVAVTFYNPEGKPLTKEKPLPEGVEVLQQDIQLEGDTVGRLVLGLSFASVEEEAAEVAHHINELVEQTDTAMEEASMTLAGLIATAAVLTVLILCGAIYFCLRLFVTRPVQRVMQSLETASVQVNTTSDQLSSASHQFAEGASEQAAALEETSSSLEEMAATIRQNAEHATQGDQLMKEADQVLGKANQSMARQTAAMEEISRASEETSKIIKTIDEIAFQTNLLALNAAVEAARAGEAGAGFAVVAEEVRNLAMRAAEAARNTASLIEGTTKKVKEGEEMVHQTNEDFSEVSAIITKVESLVGGIATASQEQTQGIDQINRAVAEIDKVTQQTAAGAEEAASASEEMTAQAGNLENLVHDLMALVGGAAGRGEQARQADRHRMSGNGAPSAPRPPSFSDSRQPSKALPAAAAPKKTALKQGSPARAAEPPKARPQEIIPFDEDAFEDF